MFSDPSGNFRSSGKALSWSIPGPLEGGEKPNCDQSAEFSKIIVDELKIEPTGPDSFVALVNIGLVFGLSKDIADLAASRLKTGKYSLRKIKTRDHLVATLYGLATVAAVSRSKTLADALRNVVRRYRNDAEFTLSFQETANILLSSAASRCQLDDWVEYVEDCMSELALDDLPLGEGRECYAYVLGLCHVVPELRPICGKTLAALSVFEGT